MSIILDYIFMLGGMVGLAGLALAAFLYLPAPMKGYALLVLAGASVCILAYNAGYRKMAVRCEEATVAFQAAITARDGVIGRHAQELSDALTAAAIKASADIDKRVSDYEKTLGKGGSCRLSPADADGLRRIK